MTARSLVRLTRRGRLLVTTVTLAVVAGSTWALVSDRGLGPLDGSAEPSASALPAPATSTGTSTAPPTPSPTPTGPVAVRRQAVEPATTLLGEGVAAATVAAAAGLLATAPVVVVAADDALVPARGVAWRTGAPLLPLGAPGLEGLLDDLGTTTVVTVVDEGAVGATATPTSASAQDLAAPGRQVLRVSVEGTSVDRSALADVPAPAAVAGADAPLVLVREDDPARPLLDTVAMAGDIPLLAVTGSVAQDPRAVQRLRAAPDTAWALAGTTAAWADVDTEVLAWDVQVARSGVELPGGGLRLFPGRRLVALYGSPGAASLGVLGEQPVDGAVQRARSLAAEYQPLVDEPVVPTFEIIVTVASGGAEPTGDYSRRVPLDQVEPWVDAAGEAGMYVVLDLQPGRTDFLTQAREVEPLLRRPHVGLALDPEWRLRPDQVHLDQIGSVAVDEVQAVADWLAELTRRAGLPQKLLLLHQFRASMLPDRERLQVPPELALVIQMDGQGSQPAKDGTWQVVTTDPPAGAWFGWKNFYDEDVTLRSPADTMAVEPEPVLVSYQ